MNFRILILAVFVIQVILKILLADNFGYANTLVSQILVVFVPTFIYLIGNEKRIDSYVKIQNRHFAADIFVVAVTAMAVNVVSQYINYPVVMLLELEDAAISINNSVYEIIINIIVLCAIPAFFEELLFRGVILSELSKRYSSAKSILISAIIFSLLHLDAANIIPQFLFGAVLAYMTLCAKSVLIPMTAHFANNLFVLLLREQTIYCFADHSTLLFVLGLLITAIGVVYFKFKCLRREI